MARSMCRLLLVGATLGLGPSAARASNKYLEVPPVELATASPAYRYANLGDDDVLAELAARGIPFARVEPAVPGVRLPIRLSGPLHGVAVHSALPEEKRKTSAFEILDARLALALDDFCKLLAEREIVELVHFTIYRPGAYAPAIRSGGSSSPLPLASAGSTRHPGGLAVDVGALRKRTGEWLTVGQHWSSAIGAKTCGQGARALENGPGRELQDIVCAAYAKRIFHYTLTPHFDKAHHDHLHLEIKPVVKWFLVN